MCTLGVSQLPSIMNMSTSMCSDTCFFQYRVLSVLYFVYLSFLTSALVLASKSSDPRQYNDGKDYLRLGFEMLSLLYILAVIVIDSIIFM